MKIRGFKTRPQNHGANDGGATIVLFPLGRRSDDVTRRHLWMEQVQENIDTREKKSR